MPGFCIFYTETNEKDFDYEKATLVIYGNIPVGGINLS